MYFDLRRFCKANILETGVVDVHELGATARFAASKRGIVLSHALPRLWWESQAFHIANAVFFTTFVTAHFRPSLYP